MSGIESKQSQTLVFVINVDWYFKLHWLDRAAACVAAGYDVHLITNFTEDSIKKAIEAVGVTTHHIQINRKTLNPFSDLEQIRSSIKILRQLKPTITHSITAKPNIYCGIFKRFFSGVLFCSVTGLGIGYSGKNSIASTTIRLVLNRLYSLAFSRKNVFVFFENSHDRDLLVDKTRLVKERTQVVHGAGVDVNQFSISDEPETNVCVLFAARLLKSKGLQSLINATKKLKEKGIQIELKVAGIIDEDSRDRISQSSLTKWHEQGDINWLGQSDDMPSLIANSHIVCLPSTYGEGIPRILIEAGACARPVISTNVPGCNEFVEDGQTGLLVAPNDDEALMNALERLYVDQELRLRLGKNARDKVEKSYSNESVIHEILSTYKKVAANT